MLLTLDERWQLASAVILRPEPFGGMAFHRERGITLEVDQAAYRLLCAFLAPRSLPPAGHPAAHLVPQLVRLGLLRPADEAAVARPRPAPCACPVDGALSAPETVHLAITTRCNLACPGCYVFHGEGGPEWTVPELHTLIDQCADLRVFQLAIGGGEPLLYEGLFDVLAYARRRGLVPNLTTNGTLLDAGVARRLVQAGVARVNLSWSGPTGKVDGRPEIAARALSLLLDTPLKVGVNVLVTAARLPHLPRLLARLQGLGVRRVTILRPKPSTTREGQAWYRANRLGRADLRRLRAVLSGWRGVLRVEVGSALLGLMGDVPPDLLRWRGIYGCTAGRRMCTVWPDGRVTPCSFLPDLDGGNLRQTPLAELWQRGMNWAALRDPARRPEGGCAACPAAAQCGGAICVARYEGGHLWAGDAQCPFGRQG